jgi:hypothetical protein
VLVHAGELGLDVKCAVGEPMGIYPYGQLRSWWDDVDGFSIELLEGGEVRFSTSSGMLICVEMKSRAKQLLDSRGNGNSVDLTADGDWFQANNGAEDVLLHVGELGLEELTDEQIPVQTWPYKQMLSWYPGAHDRFTLVVDGGDELSWNNMHGACTLAVRMKHRALLLARCRSCNWLDAGLATIEAADTDDATDWDVNVATSWFQGKLGDTAVRLYTTAAGLDVKSVVGEPMGSYPYDRLRSWWDDVDGFSIELLKGEEVRFSTSSGMLICVEMKSWAKQLLGDAAPEGLTSN